MKGWIDVSQELNDKINEMVPLISYAIGFDASDDNAKNLIEALIRAGIDDMRGAGVTIETILTNALVKSALTIFVNDNLTVTSGKHAHSPMYISNVDKLRG